MKKMIYLGCVDTLLPWYGAECWFYDDKPLSDDGLTHVVFADTDSVVFAVDLIPAELVYGVINAAMELGLQPDCEPVPGNVIHPIAPTEGFIHSGLSPYRYGASFIDACPSGDEHRDINGATPRSSRKRE